MKSHLLLSLFLGLFALLLSISPIAWAGVNLWTSIGPVGANKIKDLLINPNNTAVLYLGTSDTGVYKSTDGGATWTQSNGGPIYIYANKLVIDPSAPATIYAGSYLGVYKSTDGGLSWINSNTGFTPTSEAINALAIDPKHTATLYAGSLLGGVYKSDNGGLSWSPANYGLPSLGRSDIFVTALAIDPSSPATLYAGSSFFGVFKSTDGGANWQWANNGLTYLTVSGPLLIDPSNPAILYAATYSTGVYKSTNGGGSWSPANTGMTSANVTALAIDPSQPTTLYAGTLGNGVFKSVDGGGSWTPFNNGLTNTTVNSLTIDPSNPSNLYAGTDGGGLFKFQKQVTPGSNVECLFNWAESNYPSLFAPTGSPSVVSGIFTYRLYSATNSYLGVSSSDGHVYYHGPDGIIQDEGPLSDWLPKAGCQVSAPPPVDCLFNWAEKNYANLFSPAGTPDAMWTIYTYRYYSATKAYLGVSSKDNHIYYQGVDGNLQDEGALTVWLAKAGCQ